MFRLCCVLTLAIASTTAVRAAELGERDVLRRAVAIERVGRELCVLNRRAGTLSVVDLASRTVTGEVAVAEMPAAMTRLPERNQLLVCDESRHELVRLERSPNGWKVAGRVSVAKHPVGVAVAGSRAVVTSLWSRRLTFVDLAGDALRVTKTVDLAFAPRLARALPDGKTVVVTAAFGGGVAVVDVESAEVVRTFEIEGHNLAGMAIDRDAERLLVTHQLLRDDTGTDYESVFWGGVLKNVMRAIPLAELRTPATDDAVVEFLGFPSDAAGDPAGVAVSDSGATVVAIAGVDAAMVRRKATEPFGAFPTGRRPTAVAFGEDARFAFVANAFGDSVTVIDVERLESAGTIALGPSPKPSLVDRGEALFHDARLSLDGWYSCHSCHTAGHANAGRTDNLTDGYYGDPKRVPTLLGVDGTAPFAWYGSAETLAGQTASSIRHTMQGEQVESDDVAAITAYVRTLEPPPGLDVARGTVDAAAVKRGRRVFGDRGCADCHAEPNFTTAATYDVGLRDKEGHREFNPPSLLGVSQRDSFLHDGRAKSLRDVFETVKHPDDAKWSPEELDDLLAYLRSL